MQISTYVTSIYYKDNIICTDNLGVQAFAIHYFNKQIIFVVQYFFGIKLF